jgi:hypothetical protein
MIPKNVGPIGIIGLGAGLAPLSRIAAAAADNHTSVKNELDKPAQTNAVDPAAPVEPLKSRQVRRAEARRSVKNTTSTNKRLGIE